MIRTISAALLLWPAVALAQITGPARAIDGDTIVIGSEHIRLSGIDAPEKRQTCEGRDGQTYLCGQDAAAVMRELTRDKEVTCVARDHDRYGRTVAVCAVEGVPDIGGEMVRRGQAVPYMRYGGSRYLPEQQEAKNAKLGLWSGRFIDPAQWRHGQR